MSIRILIADDHGVLRAGLRALLSAEPDLEVVGEAADGHEILSLASELRPEVVLLDISMPGLSGIEVTRRLKEILPDVRVLILTFHEDESLLQEAIRAGAAGYIVKRAAESELIDAIRAVWRGDLYVHPVMTRALLKDLSPSPVSNKAPGESLTPREIEVLRLIAHGYTNRQTAEALSISVRTVESHRGNLMDKLSLRSRVGLVRYAKEHGLIE
jgi:two-component system, NarL family, response regulator NreC